LTNWVRCCALSAGSVSFQKAWPATVARQDRCGRTGKSAAREQQAGGDLYGAVDPDEGFGVGRHLGGHRAGQGLDGSVDEPLRHGGLARGIAEGVDTSGDEYGCEHRPSDTAENHAITTFVG
jgi:hypothetical protein